MSLNNASDYWANRLLALNSGLLKTGSRKAKLKRDTWEER